MQLAFIDMSTPRPYALRSLDEEGIGGSESSLVRIAEALDGTVLQHNRTMPDGRYLPIAAEVDPTHVVAFREPEVALSAIERFPGAKILLWMQDLCPPESNRGRRMAAAANALADAGVVVVGVSSFHEHQIRAALGASHDGNLPVVTHIFNPVVIPQLPDEPYDPDQLIFFSSPHKGLKYTVTVFDWLRRRIPSLRLLVGNPGYMKDLPLERSGVSVLGPLPQAAILAHVRRSLCTFMPNYVFEETFGCVMAESHAVGTPVLAHPIGAAPEVLGDPGQWLDVPRSRRWVDRLSARLPRAAGALESVSARLGVFRPYLERIERWRAGERPRVGLNPAFGLDAVAARWRAILDAA
jgi:glycosyltransferase involved in cell wall biosynthesis